MHTFSNNINGGNIWGGFFGWGWCYLQLNHFLINHYKKTEINI